MENREIPILHKPRAFGRKYPLGAADFLFVPGHPEQTKNDLLCALRVSAVKFLLPSYISYLPE
jgi:hypothetical protein